MRLLRASVKSSCTIALVSDTHDGSVGYHEEGVRRVVDRVASDKRCYLAHLGDMADSICSDDKRYHYDPQTKRPLPLQQFDNVVNTFAPAAKRMLCVMDGNHEMKLHRFGNVTQDLIACPLGVQYGGYTCKLALEDKFGLICKLFLWHGPIRGSVTSNAKDHQQRLANMQASVRRYLENKTSDACVSAFGHTHRLIVVPPAPKLLMHDDGTELRHSYLKPAQGSEAYIEPDRRWYVNTGSYLRSQMLESDSYAEMAGYDPIELGHVEVDIEDRAVVNVRRVVAG